ncbi:MAG: hypothetical protein AAFV88_13270 [Planctomycetota bacterium]
MLQHCFFERLIDSASTLAEFFVRPALFWMIGIDAGKQIVRDHAVDSGKPA